MPALNPVCMQVPFTPRRWRPTNPDVPQVPFTFALRPAPPRAPGKRARSGSKGAGEDPGGGLVKRQRVRKLLPTAWTTGEAAAGSGSGVGFILWLKKKVLHAGCRVRGLTIRH